MNNYSNGRLATARIAAAAQIDPSYSPGGANVHFRLIRITLLLRLNGISTGSPVSARLAIVINTQTQTTERPDMPRNSAHASSDVG